MDEQKQVPLTNLVPEVIVSVGLRDEPALEVITYLRPISSQSP